MTLDIITHFTTRDQQPNRFNSSYTPADTKVFIIKSNVTNRFLRYAYLAEDAALFMWQRLNESHRANQSEMISDMLVNFTDNIDYLIVSDATVLKMRDRIGDVY